MRTLVLCLCSKINIQFQNVGNLNAGFRQVCTVKADLSGLSGALTRHVGPDGVFWRVYYSVALKFGGTELRASLIWQEKGVTRRGLASIIPFSQI